MSGARKIATPSQIQIGQVYYVRVGTRIAKVVVRGSTVEHRGGVLFADGDPRRKVRPVTIWHCETLDTHRMVRATARRLRLAP